MRLRGGLCERNGELYIGEYKATDLAGEYGTPLYVYNQEFIVAQCQAINEALSSYPAGAQAYYASKAYPAAAIDRLIAQHGFGIDVATLGELFVAIKAGVPMAEIIVHGAYKSDEYLREALRRGVGLVVIDSLSEIVRLDKQAAAQGIIQRVLIRINPGVEAETHKAVRTANLDTKFGIPLAGRHAHTAVRMVLESKNLSLCGVHCHVGSQVFKMDVYDVAAGILLSFMKEAAQMGACMDILNIGGGFGSWYSRGDTPMQMLESVQVITNAVTCHCARLKMDLPRLMIEPGRAVVAESAAALYTAGVVKEIPGVNHYVVIDGGLFENPRPNLYGSRYTAFLADRIADKPERYYTISGMSCEGDTLIQRVKLPIVKEGDVLAMPSAGAYQLAMAGNYNRMPKPAALLVNGGRIAVIQRRETLEDVLMLDMIPDDLN